MSNKNSRRYESKVKENNYNSDKISEHLNEVLEFTGFRIVDNENYGEMGIISVEGGKDMTTFSQVLMTQFQEEALKGFPFQAKIIQKKRYYTLEAP